MLLADDDIKEKQERLAWGWNTDVSERERFQHAVTGQAGLSVLSCG